MNLTFYIVDVFAEEKYAGNQLAVVRGGTGLPDETLQKIALERNYSETTFALTEEETEGSYDVRIFTPGDEVPFAGHPTLGTAYVIQHEILASPFERITLKLKAGEISVTFGEVLWMRQLQPTFGAILDSALFARTLNLETAEPHDDGPGDLSARMIANDLGVSEDPATGSAAGCLAAYLLEHGYLGTDSVDVRVEQGYEIDRPSLLYLQAARDGDEMRVDVGGKVQMVARGELV